MAMQQVRAMIKKDLLRRNDDRGLAREGVWVDISAGVSDTQCGPRITLTGGV